MVIYCILLIHTTNSNGVPNRKRTYGIVWQCFCVIYCVVVVVVIWLFQPFIWPFKIGCERWLHLHLLFHMLMPATFLHLSTFIHVFNVKWQARYRRSFTLLANLWAQVVLCIFGFYFHFLGVFFFLYLRLFLFSSCIFLLQRYLVGVIA